MALKKPTPKQKGLKKLPKTVRNKMGYMSNGGTMKKKGYAKGGGTPSSRTLTKEEIAAMAEAFGQTPAQFLKLIAAAESMLKKNKGGPISKKKKGYAKGGAMMKKKGMAKGGAMMMKKKKGYAKGGAKMTMKKKGYAKGGATMMKKKKK